MEKENEGREYVLRCIIMVCWQIWKDRYDQVFHRKKINLGRCIRKVHGTVEELGFNSIRERVSGGIRGNNERE